MTLCPYTTLFRSKYVEEDDTEIPQLSPASEKKLIGEIAHAEWKHEIKKRINQSGNFVSSFSYNCIGKIDILYLLV